MLAVAAVSPVFVLPFAENYLTQFLSIALWPFAMAALYAFVRAPRDRPPWRSPPSALGAVAGVYPPLAAVVRRRPRCCSCWSAPRRRPRLPSGRETRRWRSGAALLVLAPVILVRAYESVVLVGGLVASNAAFPLFQASRTSRSCSAADSQFALTPRPAVDHRRAAGRARAAARRRGGRRRRGLDDGSGSSGSVRARRSARRRLGITLFIYLKYKYGDDYGYGTYKALLSGGALLAGLLMVALASPSARWRSARLVAAGVCVAVWVPVTADVLQHQRDGSQGFRESDNALIHELGTLPQDEVVLVEGAAENAFSFQLRMTTGYVAAASTTAVRRDSARRSRTSPAAAPRCGARGGRGATWCSSDAPSAFPRTGRPSGTTRRTGCRTRRRST